MPETTSHQLVVFSLGSEEYALHIGTAHEIIQADRVIEAVGKALN